MASPLERSKALLEEQGYHVWKVERPASMYQPTLDLFNFGDLLAIRDDVRGSVAIQCCGEDVSPHVHKILEGFTKDKIEHNKETGEKKVIEEKVPPNPYVKTWLNAGNLLFIWGWRLRGEKGKRKTYQLRQIEFVIQNGVVVANEIPDTSELENK